MIVPYMSRFSEQQKRYVPDLNSCMENISPGPILDLLVSVTAPFSLNSSICTGSETVSPFVHANVIPNCPSIEGQFSRVIVTFIAGGVREIYCCGSFFAPQAGISKIIIKSKVFIYFFIAFSFEQNRFIKSTLLLHSRQFQNSERADRFGQPVFYSMASTPLVNRHLT